jgi:hypothetical protein
MLRLTRWAQAQPRKARLLLILLHGLLVMVSIRLGLGLDLAGIAVPAFAPVVAAVVVAVGFLVYPYAKPANRATWRRRKAAESTILTGSVVAIALCSALVVATPIPELAPAKASGAAAVFTSLTHPDATLDDKTTAKQQRRDRRLWRQALRAKAKDYLRKQQRKIDKWGAGVLIFVTVVLAAFLELLVLGLACSISCNGAEGLAVVVGLLGTAGVVLLAVLAIGAILRARRRSENPDGPVIRRRRTPRKKVLE